MSEDITGQYLKGIHDEVKELRSEGNARGKKIDELVVNVTKTEVRVDHLEKKNKEHVHEHKEVNRRMEHVEKRVYQLGCAILLVAGGLKGAEELLSLIF